MSRIVFDLVEIPEFKNEIDKMFREMMSGRVTEILYKVDSYVVKVGKAIRANEKKWYRDEYSFDYELSRMTDWITKRYEYFEEIYGDIERSMSMRML